MSGPGESQPAKELLIERIRAAAHAAVDAGDGAAAIELTRLLEQRRAVAGWGEVTSLDDARRRRARRK